MPLLDAFHLTSLSPCHLAILAYSYCCVLLYIARSAVTSMWGCPNSCSVSTSLSLWRPWTGPMAKCC